MASIDRLMSESAGEDSEQLELTHNTGRGGSNQCKLWGNCLVISVKTDRRYIECDPILDINVYLTTYFKRFVQECS